MLTDGVADMIWIKQTFLLLFLADSTGGRLTLHYAQRYDEAQHACHAEGGKLPLPEDETSNEALKSFLLKSNITSTWISAKITVRAPWMTLLDGRPIDAFDQGCYDRYGMSSPIRIESIDSETEECRFECKLRGFPFAAIRKRNSVPIRCRCVNETLGNKRLHERYCNSFCGGYPCGRHQYGRYFTYRVLSTNNAGPAHRIKWSESQSGEDENLCASISMDVSEPLASLNVRSPLASAEDAPRFLLRQEPCGNRYESICCISSRNQLMPKLTWFEANYQCHIKGGFIASEISECYSQNRENLNDSRIWTGLRAFELAIGGNEESDHLYTNWNVNQPDFEHTCMEVWQNGTWHTAACDDDKAFLCDSGSGDITSEITTSQMTTSSNTGVSVIGNAMHEAVTLPTPDGHTEFPSTSVAIGVSVGIMVILAAFLVGLFCTRRKRIAGHQTIIPGEHNRGGIEMERNISAENLYQNVVHNPDTTIVDHQFNRSSNKKFVDVKTQEISMMDNSLYSEYTEDTTESIVVDNELYS